MRDQLRMPERQADGNDAAHGLRHQDRGAAHLLFPQRHQIVKAIDLGIVGLVSQAGPRQIGLAP